MQLDVANKASVASLKRALGDRPIDAINNAGMSNPTARSADRVDAEIWMATLRVNTLGPMLVAYALRDNLRRSSEMNSRRSAATLAPPLAPAAEAMPIELESGAQQRPCGGLPRDGADDGILGAILHPGWIRTWAAVRALLSERARVG